MFDIDGTLTDTNAVDDECFLGAVAEVLELPSSEIDWSDAPHVTDSALSQWICEHFRQRQPSDAEIAAIRASFFGRLGQQLSQRPERFAEIRGARRLLESLPPAGWDIAFATGGWELSARLKLAAANIPVERMAIATSDDATTRAEIVNLAIERSGGTGKYERIVSVGDGVWDLTTARLLALPFVAVATGERAARLLSVGADIVLPNLEDAAAAHAALLEATVPTARPSGAASAP